MNIENKMMTIQIRSEDLAPTISQLKRLHSLIDETINCLEERRVAVEDYLNNIYEDGIM